MSIEEALVILNSFDNDTLLGQPESNFNYCDRVVPYCEWEDKDKIVFTIAYIPNNYNGRITSKIAEKYFSETWIVDKKTKWAEPWYE